MKLPSLNIVLVLDISFFVLAEYVISFSLVKGFEHELEPEAEGCVIWGFRLRWGLARQGGLRGRARLRAIQRPH